MRARSMILAAGKGTRMGALSQKRPKVLTPILGQSLLSRSLEKIAEASLGPTVVNLHHLADQLEAALQKPVAEGHVILSDERALLLETGGAFAQAQPLFDGAKTLLINGDSLWTDGPSGSALARLYGAFNLEKMDFLLLICPLEKSRGVETQGDVVPDFSPKKRAIKDLAPFPVALRAPDQTSDYAFMGLYMAANHLYAEAPAGPFSNRLFFEKAMAAGRLFGLLHDGLFLHVGTPSAIDEAEAVLKALQITAKKHKK